MGANWGFYNSPNAWPYTNFHDLNLDWILEKLKEQETDLSTVKQAIDATNERIDQTNTNVSNLSTQNLATLKVAENGRSVHDYFINSYFINPVNQRGATTYNSAGYCIDRWLLGSGSASIGASGITLTGAAFGQRVALKAGIYTFEFHLSTGTTLFINIQYDGASSVTQIGGEANTTGAYITASNYSPGIVMLQFVQSENVVHTATWAALYDGSYTASGGPDYVPKGYAVELAECLLHFERQSATHSEIIGNVVFVPAGATSAIFSIKYAQKRVIPTITFSNTNQYRVLLQDARTGETISATSVSSITTVIADKTYACFRVNLSSSFDKDLLCIFQREDNATEAYVDISADN